MTKKHYSDKDNDKDYHGKDNDKSFHNKSNDKDTITSFAHYKR